jgi:hypothetical protein
MPPSRDRNPNDQKSPSEKAIISIDPGTVVLIISLLILLPLLLTGFISQ